jgi:hypothetical protein
MKKNVVFLLITAFAGALCGHNNCKTSLQNQQFPQKYKQIIKSALHLTKTNEGCTMLQIKDIDCFKYKNTKFKIV